MRAFDDPAIVHRQSTSQTIGLVRKDGTVGFTIPAGSTTPGGASGPLCSAANLNATNQLRRSATELV
ncbi:MAG TPA: hypothetical protein VG826_06350 [Pirellulales bacterium]|nr:hypothetical protein [Pirellulales bacterium]